MIEKYKNLLVVLMLGAMLAMGIGSMAGDSGIVDEVAHIPAGYSYLKYGDFRLNPEHPPLLKDISAFPLLFLNLEFPLNIPAWTTDANGQWESGWHFIYHIGNNADQILFFSRLPLLILAVAFGFILYRFTLKRFGLSIALLTLFLYTFSPNVLAHAKFVTTDTGIMDFIFLAFMGFIKFIEDQKRSNVIIFGILLALAELAKFSAVLLYPFFVIVTLLIVLSKPKDNKLRLSFRYFGRLFLVFVISGLIIWAFYIPHTMNMPESVQDKLITSSLQSGFANNAGQLLTQINHLPLMKALAQYLLGLLMVFTRVAGGNTTYFLGQVTNQSFLLYFPVSFLIKMQIPILIGILSVTFVAIFKYFTKTPLHIISNIQKYILQNFEEAVLIFFIIFYSYFSISGNLNLGIRHLMPIMPMIFLVVAKKTVNYFRLIKAKNVQTIYKYIIGIMIFWYGLGQALIYPYSVAYFNELIGGPANADKYVTDSNVDWGQDLKRFVKYVEDHPEINKIAVDYFGGGDPRYYMCKRKYDEAGNLIPNVSGYDCSDSKFIEWHAQDGLPPTKYIAVSETFLMNDIYWANLRGDEGYAYLRAKTPIAKVGYSIYVYEL